MATILLEVSYCNYIFAAISEVFNTMKPHLSSVSEKKSIRKVCLSAAALPLLQVIIYILPCLFVSGIPVGIHITGQW
jgi:hypothetical protein